MDLELIDWLNTYTFPEEAKYGDLKYASAAYRIFADDLKRSATTRANIFATIHPQSTEILMDLLEEIGIKAMVGKVNMNRNAPDGLCEKDSKTAVAATRAWIDRTQGRYKNIKPILTPRFVPSCTDELMEQLGVLAREYGLPVQSHLSENLGEIAWVQELCPDTTFYGEAYERYGLFGGETRTVMAHCVHCPPEETALLKERGVFVAHCPQSNTNLSSGIAPARRYLDQGILMGLGTDIAGGCHMSIFRAMADAIGVSKLRWRLKDEQLAPLGMEEAFYLGTKGGGAFFGKVGSFEDGYEVDAVILDDSALPHPQILTIRQRLERMIYLSDDRQITAKYVAGSKVL